MKGSKGKLQSLNEEEGVLSSRKRGLKMNSQDLRPGGIGTYCARAMGRSKL